MNDQYDPRDVLNLDGIPKLSNEVHGVQITPLTTVKDLMRRFSDTTELRLLVSLMCVHGGCSRCLTTDSADVQASASVLEGQLSFRTLILGMDCPACHKHRTMIIHGVTVEKVTPEIAEVLVNGKLRDMFQQQAHSGAGRVGEVRMLIADGSGQVVQGSGDSPRILGADGREIASFYSTLKESKESSSGLGRKTKRG